MGVVNDLRIDVNEDPNCYKVDKQGYLRVSGSVVFRLTKATDVRHLQIVCSGESRLDWLTGSCDALDLLFKEEQFLIMTEGSSLRKLSAGKHFFPFSFEIHSERHLPTISIGKHGSISYKLLTRMEIAGDVFSLTAELPITVYNPMKTEISQFTKPIVITRLPTERRCYVVTGMINKGYLTLLSDEKLTVSLSITIINGGTFIPRVSLEECVTFCAPDGNNQQVVRTLCVKKGNNITPIAIKKRWKLTLGPVRDVITGTIENVNNISVTYNVVIKAGGYSRSFPIQVGFKERGKLGQSLRNVFNCC